MKRSTKVLYLAIGLFLIIVLAFALLGAEKKSQIQTIRVTRTDLRKEVNVTGNVKPITELELKFPFEGTVAKIYVDEGDIVKKGKMLAELDREDLFIEQKKAQAQLELRRSELNKLLTPPSILSEAPSLDVEKEYINLLNAANDLFNSILSVKNTLFALTRNSNLMSILPERYNLETALNEINIDKLQQEHSKLSSTLTTQRIENFAKLTKEEADKAYTATVMFDKALSLTLPGNRITQSDIENYMANIRTRREVLQDSRSTLLSAQINLASRHKALSSDIEILKAKIATEEANVAEINKKLNDSLLVAPVNGIITDVLIEAGERITKTDTVVKMIGSADLIIEANIPESDIAWVNIGDRAEITLDAFGEDKKWNAEVIEISPSETILEGISTYKTKFRFLDDAQGVKPGMTANISLIAEEKKGVIAVPARLIIEKEGKRFVKVLKNGKVEEVMVDIGFRSSDGQIEIKNGLNEGEEVVVDI